MLWSRALGIILVILGILSLFMELSITICLNKPIVGPTLIYIAAILFIYSYYKEERVSKKVALAVFLIVSIPYVYHMQNEWPCENFFNSPTSMIKNELSKAYTYPQLAMRSDSKASFHSGLTLSGSFAPFKDASGGATEITFECSSELRNACNVLENGATLKVDRDFSAYVRAICCSNNVCKVKIGEETARC